jgi:16S rRNA (cytidine1402-2'-O)-methyltransferase
MNGQRFSFSGYLPRNEGELVAALKSLEQESKRDNVTQMFIETPYRNDKMLAVLLKHLHPNTSLCLASNITAPNQMIVTKTITEWRKSKLILEKKPTVFLLFSGVLVS